MEYPLENYTGCLMAYINISQDIWNEYITIIDNNDLYIEDNTIRYGIEKTPHCNVLYGLNIDNNRVDIKIPLLNINRFNIQANKISSFTNEKFDVLKFEINSPELKDINNFYRTNFDYKNQYDIYIPHITIAYLKPNTSKKYIELFNNKFKFPINFQINRFIYATEYEKTILQVKLK